MSIYFIRNTETGGWLDTNSGHECGDAEKASCRYWSVKSAKKTIRDLVSWANKTNKYYEENPDKKWDNWKPYPTSYEVVEFRLVEAGVVE